MVQRIRTRSKSGPSGTLRRSSGSSTPSVLIPALLRETVTDEVLPGNGHSFYLERYGLKKGFDEPPRSNGRYWSGSAETIVENYPVPRLNEIDYFLKQHEFVMNVPGVATAATELVAKTNPSRPHFDMTVFARELKEMPQLLAERSEDLARDISSKRLSLEFGWKPFIGDMMNVLTLVDAFHDRVREIDHLERSGIRRKRKLFTGSSPIRTVWDAAVANDRGYYVWAKVENVTKVEVWGFVKWKIRWDPIDAFLGTYKGTSKEGRALFAILGITPTLADLSTVWELMPYSWLVDWCSNVGDYLAAHRNVVGAQPEDIQIMQRTYTESTMTVVKDENTFVTLPKRAVRYRETKLRTPVSTLSVEAHFPFLTERKIAIFADVVNGIFRRSKIDGRRGAFTQWKWEESKKPFISPWDKTR